jgi:hypothetical protein
MFQHSRRGTMVWLALVGIALVLALAAEEMPTAVGAVLLAAYLVLVAVVTRNTRLGSVLESLTAPRSRRVQSSEVAREAMARARSHPSYDPLIPLVDVGLVVDEQRPDGLSLRRGRFISLDDEGIRPFAIFHVPETLSERVGRIRFEIRDESNHPQYVYETEKWLTAGENTILPDYRFPIRTNSTTPQAGAWTVQVLIDGCVLGIHNFSLSPSLTDRRRQMSSDGEIRERVWRGEEEDTSLPLSLEELLRQQSRQQADQS